MNKSLTFSFVIISFILGIGTGYIFTPEYANQMKAKNNPMVELGTADRFVDLRYINGVIAHHLNAIFLAKQALANSDRAEIKSLASEIIASDEASIKTLYQWKKDWYQDTKVIDKYEKINLGQKDSNFDLRFLNTLTNHHDEAIGTAKEILTKSNRQEILNLAQGIRDGLTSSKTQLQSWRKTWYSL